jgi:glycosyltransferase involved in cell wall biosynthesis
MRRSGAPSMGTASKMGRILYVQFTNPAAYPPLEHSARLLADAGWDVMFLGTRALGADRLEFQPHQHIRVKHQPFVPGGWRQKVLYARFLLWVLGWVLVWRPRWVYASDHLACPVGLAVSLLSRARIIYHEHDSPPPGGASRFHDLTLAARRVLAHRAVVCVLPNQRRVETFARQVGPWAKLLCVWNCPTRDEVSPARPPCTRGDLWVLYHGSIVPDRLPMSVVMALTLVPVHVKLRIVGYETVGHRGYVEELRALAAEHGLDQRVHFVGAVVSRHEVMMSSRECHVGLAFLPKSSHDLTDETMVGASNKPFDYMASGLALLVSDLPLWRATFVDNGYGLACDSDDPKSIADALRWFDQHRETMAHMGQRGQQRVLGDWNYEAQFAPLMAILSG